MTRARRSNMGLLISLGALVALLCALVPAFASAAVTHNPEPFSPLNGTGSGLTLEEPWGIAIDEATGNVFVTDTGFGHERVAILGGEGGTPVDLAPPYEIAEIQFPTERGSLAYDNAPTSPARGTLYVYNVGSKTLEKYVRNATSERYEAGGSVTIPGLETDNVTLSTDSSGDLYVSAEANFGVNAKIFKFSPSGALLAEYVLPSSLGSPGQVAVDSAGDLFVQAVSAGIYEFPANGSGEIDPAVNRQFAAGFTGGVTIDPATNHVFAGFRTGIAEYDSSGERIDEFGTETVGVVGHIAFDSASGRIYAADGGFGFGGHADVNVFGPPVTVPTTRGNAASNVTGTRATLNGSVNPEGIEVESCFFEWGETVEYGHTAPCKELPPTDSEAHAVSAEISGLEANGVNYHFRLVATNKNGKEASGDRSFETVETVVTQAASGVGSGAVTLNGSVRPEGVAFSSCKFEYGLATSGSLGQEAACDPAAGEIEPDFSAHPVTAAVTGLQANTTYRVRLVAVNAAGSFSGEELEFTTNGPPQITDIRASNADKSTALVGAKVDPRGTQTNYYVEWGPTVAYGNRIPANGFEPSVGAGGQPVQISASLSGLVSGARYHYRVVASSAAGTTTSPDQELETVDSCGLPEGRCMELVSPRDAGPIAEPGRAASGEEIAFQAAAEPGSLAYVIAGGLPDATRGDQVLYHGQRGASGWSSSQLSPKILVPNETDSGNTDPAKTRGLSDDLSCGLVESNQPLTSDPGTQLVVEAGGANLYRHNPDGSYTAVTSLPPLNLDAVNGFLSAEYILDGFSKSCGKVVFASRYRYPGVPVGPAAEGFWLYEWDEGVLHGVGVVPASGGEEAIAAVAGTETNHHNVVSEDGSRVFFSANRQTAPNTEEVGKTAVFVREAGAPTRDLSLSETATPDRGATFQYASKDGSRVFFTANAGLTAESSATGVDLYEYDLASAQLTDLSVDHDPAGAEVAGFIGASRDGSHVYFAARGQLLPGRGRSFAQNVAEKTFSIYGEDRGVLSYVGSLTATDVIGNQGITVEEQSIERGISVSPDGRFLLFQTSANVTGYESAGVKEAYLYDAAATIEPTVCVSCRQDGRPPVTPQGNAPLGHSSPGPNPLYETTWLAVRDGMPTAFFISYDRLAPGASEVDANLYEWAHGQVFLITTEPPGLRDEAQESKEQFMAFADASAEGTDLYFVTPASLTWEDGDGRSSVYDARVGGGFPEPARPAPPCSAITEGSCQGALSRPPAPAGAASSTFAGPGNLLAPLAPSPHKPKLTRAQQLAKALRGCRRYRAKARRASCERSARSKYGSGRRAKTKPSKKAKSHRGSK